MVITDPKPGIVADYDLPAMRSGAVSPTETHRCESRVHRCGEMNDRLDAGTGRSRSAKQILLHLDQVGVHERPGLVVEVEENDSSGVDDKR
jgi:hypothetical protein